MKKDFLDYIEKEFNFSKEEIDSFKISLSQGLKKTIRINTNKISIQDFKKIAEKKWWILTETMYGKNIFYIDRINDLKTPLGNTIEHLNGYFYIQELAASSAPFFLSGDTIDEQEYLILDMSASPWGKTSSLSEYYPNSLIVANELDKKRLKTLFENTDRMGNENVVITNYDGRFFQTLPEIFDKILLDAPCSGEGTAFKTDDALKYRNIKNIKNIAKLQHKLLESALISLKVWGEIVYSTCTLNTIENEGVIEKIFAEYGKFVEIIPISTNLENSQKQVFQGRKNFSTWIYWTVSEWETIFSDEERRSFSEFYFKRNWPHRDNTGWFFVAKIKKIASLPIKKEKNKQRVIQNIEKLSSKTEKMIQKFLRETFWFETEKKHFFSFMENIYMSSKSGENLWDDFFFYKAWLQIGEIKDWIFEPNFFVGTLKKFEKGTLNISEDNFSLLMQGYEIDFQKEDGYYQILLWEIPAWIGKLKNNKLKSLLPQKFIRK